MPPHRHWPLYGLRITTPRLELRLPDSGLLDELAEVAAGGVHGDGEMPFSVPWTDGGPRQRARGVVQHVLGTIAQWRTDSWALSLAVRLRSADADAETDADTGSEAGKPVVVGRQDLSATDFAVAREAGTGSWLGTTYQGLGIGTEMRAAVVHPEAEAIVRNVLGLTGIAALTAVLLGARLSWLPALLYALPAYLAADGTVTHGLPALWTWLMQDGSQPSGWWVTCGLFAAGSALFAWRGPRPEGGES